MHTTTHATAARLQQLKAAGAQYIVVQKHARDGIQQGSVITWHRTHEAAARAAGADPHLYVKEIGDAISDANE